MFDSLTQRFEGIFSNLRGKGRLSEADVDAALREVRLALLEADVNVAVVKTFLARVRERALGADVSKSLTPGQQVIKIVHEELVATLGGETAPLKTSSSPQVILMVGLQGSGKTTTAGKLARHLKGKGRRPLLVAADLQRPAAIDQLETLGRRLEVPVFAERKSKPTRVVKAALKEATRAGHDVVIVDTAGRLQIDDALMKELADVAKVAEPDETLLVVDAMTGQDAVNVAKGFVDNTPLTGIVLSKLDGDARGGAAISVREVTGAPVKFAGVGEGLDDLEPFHPDRMASRILGMGDVLTLIEKAEATFDAQEAEKAAAKMVKGQFTLEDFLEQFQQIKKMGPLQDILSMLPGANSMLRQVEIDDREIKRMEAIIYSMTPEERRNPKIMSGSRKRRVASGSGTSPQEVNKLLKQFSDAQKMMKGLGGKGLAGLAGMMGGRGR
ncbi:MAG TPA: signal recognition particle protein [Acidimicrobiia bacterium]|jgi:signal recognition particle subunit SRP54|nr:signal recognition particle protein [Acidimicrobiia bacterium]